MDCDQAQNAMMLYMDKSIKPGKASALHRHVLKCESCREYFLAFDNVMESVSGLDTETDTALLKTVEAPDGFVDSVMEKVRRSPIYTAPATPVSAEAAGSADTGAFDMWLRAIWGFFAVLMGVGFIFAYNEEAINALLAANPRLAAVTGWVNPVAAFFAEVSNQLTQALDVFTAQTTALILNVGNYLLIVIGVLAVALVYVMRKEKLNA